MQASNMGTAPSICALKNNPNFRHGCQSQGLSTALIELETLMPYPLIILLGSCCTVRQQQSAPPHLHYHLGCGRLSCHKVTILLPWGSNVCAHPMGMKFGSVANKVKNSPPLDVEIVNRITHIRGTWNGKQLPVMFMYQSAILVQL